MIPRKRSKRSRSNHGKSRNVSESKALEQKAMLEDNIIALQRQEQSGQYTCADYLSMTTWKRSIYDLLKRNRQSQHQQGDARVDEYCREQIVEWSFRVVDYFRIDREVVAVSLSFLDRFLVTCQCDRSTFKLAATTTLHLAVKLLHPCKLGDLGMLSDLSRGEFDMHDVAEMEAHVLHSLAWSLHPPTANAYSTLLLDYVMHDSNLNMTQSDIDDLHDISSFFTELAVCDYYFVTMKPREVALAAVVNALEGMFGHENGFTLQILSSARRLGIYQNQDLSSATQRLWELYERSEECALHNSYEPMEEEKISGPEEIYVRKRTHEVMEVSDSPVSVASNNQSVPTNEFMCAMRSQSLRNGSW